MDGAEGFDEHVRRGGELLRDGAVEAARERFRAALAEQPDEPRALGLLGLCCFRLGAFEEARTVYGALTAREPDDASYRLNLGLVHLKLGDARAAVAELTRSRALDPSQRPTIGYLGLAHARLGDYRRAYEAFLRAEQPSLAQEVEQHLSADEREAIRAAVAVGGVPVAEAEGAPAAAAPEPTDDAVPSPASGVITQAVATARLLGEDAAAEFDIAPVAPPLEAGAAPPPVRRGSSVAAWLATRHLDVAPYGPSFALADDGALIVRVAGRLLVRADGVVARGGALEFAPAHRRMRGAASDQPLGDPARPIFEVSGEGFLIARPAGVRFATLDLDEDIVYLREGLVFGFEERLGWESGRVPGSDGRIKLLQLRGEGAVAIACPRPLVALSVTPDRPVQVAALALAGWCGRVVPRLAGGGAASIDCGGDGVVLVEVAGAPAGAG